MDIFREMALLKISELCPRNNIYWVTASLILSWWKGFQDFGHTLSLCIHSNFILPSECFPAFSKTLCYFQLNRNAIPVLIQGILKEWFDIFKLLETFPRHGVLHELNVERWEIWSIDTILKNFSYLLHNRQMRHIYNIRMGLSIGGIQSRIPC